MAQYIELDPLVAEIEKRIKETESMQPKFDQFWAGQISAYKGVLKIIDSHKVKEVDFDAEWKKYFEYRGEIATVNVKHLAKHFFEIGLKAKNWEKERMEECPYRQVGCTMYEDKILECRGACSWVVDYPKLKELKAQKGK